jgi:hypothetical protein
VVVHVQEHEFFPPGREQSVCEIPANFTTVALGGEIQVPTLDGLKNCILTADRNDVAAARRMPDERPWTRRLFATVRCDALEADEGSKANPQQLADDCRRKHSRRARTPTNRTNGICSIGSKMLDK